MWVWLFLSLARRRLKQGFSNLSLSELENSSCKAVPLSMTSRVYLGQEYRFLLISSVSVKRVGCLHLDKTYHCHHTYVLCFKSERINSVIQAGITFGYPIWTATLRHWLESSRRFKKPSYKLPSIMPPSFMQIPYRIFSSPRSTFIRETLVAMEGGKHRAERSCKPTRIDNAILPHLSGVTLSVK